MFAYERGYFLSSLLFSAGSDMNKKYSVGGKISRREIISLDFLLKIKQGKKSSLVSMIEDMN